MPRVRVVRRIDPRGVRSTTVGALCRVAGVECDVTGPATEREVYVYRASKLSVSREPGVMGAVAVGVAELGEKDRAVLALGVLAYAVFDYVARESMRGVPEARMSSPVGRPRKAHPLSGAERQRKWRGASGSTRQ